MSKDTDIRINALQGSKRLKHSGQNNKYGVRIVRMQKQGNKSFIEEHSFERNLSDSVDSAISRDYIVHPQSQMEKL